MYYGSGTVEMLPVSRRTLVHSLCADRRCLSTHQMAALFCATCELISTAGVDNGE